MDAKTATPRRIKVLIVDDSALVRQLLTEILGADPAIEVVGTAQDAYMAREKIKRFNPDVLTLDVEMPKMDGIQFLRNLMRLRPMPVVMCSSLTERGADVTLDALALGAVEFVTKPKVDVAYKLEEYAQEITAKVKAAARARVRALSNDAAAAAVVAPSAAASMKIVEKLSADAVLPRTTQPRHFRTDGPDRRDRRLDRRHRGDQGRADPDAARRAGHRHHPAHPQGLQRGVRGPDERRCRR